MFDGLLAAFMGAALSWLVIRVRLLFAGRGLDHPGHRSLHDRPVPHGGGLGVVAAALAACLWFDVPMVWPAMIVLLAAVSMLDDAVRLSFQIRFIVHVAAAAVLLHGQVAGLHPVYLVALILLVVWTTNAYNFMDGADGLAGSMTTIGFGAYALAFAWNGQAAWAGLCAAICGGSLAFLRFNWHPASIFSGDVGAIPLGFLAGALGIMGVAFETWPTWFPLLVFAPFLADSCVTLMRRAVRGEKVWQAHREHYYQRMALMDGRHDRMCRVWVWLMIGGALLALGALCVPAWVGGGVLSVWYAVIALLGLRVDRQWKMRCDEEGLRGWME